MGYDDVIKWKHFPRYWPYVRIIHQSSVNSPHKCQWCGALMLFFYLRLNKRLSRQSCGWWFKTPSRLLYRHCNVNMAEIVELCSWHPICKRAQKGNRMTVNGYWLCGYHCVFYFNVFTLNSLPLGIRLSFQHYGDVIMGAIASHHCLLNRLFRRRSKHQSSAENVSIWRRHHEMCYFDICCSYLEEHFQCSLGEWDKTCWL